jgi:phage tail sheath gpL-like
MITFSNVPGNAVASNVFVEQEPVTRRVGGQLIPRKILILGQFNSGKSPTVNIPQLIQNREDAWDRYGRGSLLASMIETALAGSGTVPVYALPLANAGGAVASTGTFAVTGPASAPGTIAIYVAGRRLVVGVANGDSATTIGGNIEAAINANLDLPVTANNVAGTVTLTSKWLGESANQIKIGLNLADNESLPTGVAIVVTQPASGATDPVLTTALENLGNTWYTEIVSPYLSSASFTAMEVAGVARNNPGVMRQFVGFHGYSGTLADYNTLLSTRNSEWTTIFPVFGSQTPGYEIGSSLAGVFSAIQQATPGRPVKNVILPRVLSGSLNDITYAQRNTLVLAGGSHSYNQPDGSVSVGDLVTTRTTTTAGASTSDWRFTEIIPNLQFKIFQLENTFRSSPFDQGVVLADGGAPGPTYAVRPSTVKAFAVQLVDAWEALGLSTNRDQIVAGITASIDNSNPGRINLLIPDVPSAGLRILATKLEWDFVV